MAEMDLGTLQRLSGEYVGRGFTKGFSDTVWRAQWRKRQWCYVALLLELQSKPDPLMPFRLSAYTLQLLLRLAKEDKTLRAGGFPAVLPIVFYTGDAPGNIPLNAADMFGPLPAALGEYLVRQKYVLIDLCRLEAGGPELRDSLTALLARLRQAKTLAEAETVLADMGRVLRDNPDLERVFAEWSALWLQYSGVPGDWERKVHNIGEVHDMLSADVARLGNEFLAKGLAQGIEKGRAEGAREANIATALHMLRMGRFSLEDIAEITRLPLDEVRAIAESEAR